MNESLVGKEIGQNLLHMDKADLFILTPLVVIFAPYHTIL